MGKKSAKVPFTNFVRETLGPVLAAYESEIPLTGIINDVLGEKKSGKKKGGTRSVPTK